MLNPFYTILGKRNDDENAKEKLYTYVTHVPVTSFKVLVMYTPLPHYSNTSIRNSKRRSLTQSRYIDSLSVWSCCPRCLLLPHFMPGYARLCHVAITQKNEQTPIRCKSGFRPVRCTFGSHYVVSTSVSTIMALPHCSNLSTALEWNYWHIHETDSRFIPTTYKSINIMSIVCCQYLVISL